MKIIKAAVDWHDDYDNPPSLSVWIDEAPYDKLVYQKKGHCYWGEYDGYVSYFSYRGPNRGYGGREFTVKMADGSTEILKGPWSGNSLSMTAAGFPLSFEVILVYPDQYSSESRFGGCITEERFLEALS